ncbi:hypothetical protein BGZ47_005972 [Haplosporangium gracile]|nr:hypothetical protein BGZ47_005972 [Haplosporangium gracile]
MSDNTEPTSPIEGFKGSDLPPLETDEPPKVLIVGAGLAGLYLGSFLEQAGIPYEIFERAAEIKPLGGIMCLSANVFSSMEQISVYEELLKVSKPCLSGTFYTGDMKVIAQLDTNDDVTGYGRLLFARPELYDILIKRIPPHKLHMSKKLLSFQQNRHGVMLRLNDNTTVHGDVLVGADGAHSGVRQHLYKTLQAQGLLPKSDTRDLNKGYISFVGTTIPLDPAKYPGLAQPDSVNSYHIGDNSMPYSWVTFTVPGNKICWNLVIQVKLADIEEEQFRNSDWSREENMKMLEKVRDFKTCYGPLGDIIDATPKDLISKVHFEDMLFETWHHGRTVLIGDAAHKLLPSTGQGAVNAMIDAVVLANCLYDVKPTSYANIQAALDDFREQRFDYIKAQYVHSHTNAMIQFGHTWPERIFRYVILNWLPKSIMFKQIVKDSAYRPQANFLPQAPKRGTAPVILQKPSKRIQDEEGSGAKKAAATPVAI